MSALRSWLRQPLSAVLAVGTLGLAWLPTLVLAGAWSSFNVGPLPFANGDNSYQLAFHRPGASAAESGPYVRAHYIRAIRDELGAERVLPFAAAVANLDVDGRSRSVTLHLVSYSFFAKLGVPVSLGRPFGAEDSVRGNARVAVITQRFWKRHFDERPDAIGSQLRIDTLTFTIVGVLARQMANPLDEVDIWTPIDVAGGRLEVPEGCCFGAMLLGTAPSDRAVMQSGVDRALRAAAANGSGMSANLIPLRDRLRQTSIGAAVPGMLVLSALLLGVAYFNFLVVLALRALNGVRDSAVKLALGAKRSRISMQTVVDAQVLSVLALALAVVASFAIQTAFPEMAARLFPSWVEPSLDWKLLVAVMFAGSVASALCAGAAAAVSLGTTPHSILSGRSHGVSPGSRSTRAMHSVVFLELVFTALVIPVAVSSGSRLVWAGRDSHAAQIHGLVQLPIQMAPDGSGGADIAGASAVAAQLPDVVSAGVGTIVPWPAEAILAVNGVAAPRALGSGTAAIAFGSLGMLRTLDLKLRMGRFPTENEDAHSADVALLTPAAAAQLFPGQSPLGQVIQVDSMRQGRRRFTVIGVLDNLQTAPLQREGPEMRAVITLLKSPTPSSGTLLLRMRSATSSSSAFAREQIARAIPSMRIGEASIVADAYRGQLAVMRSQFLAVVAICAALAVVAFAGVLGTTSYAVTSRTQEIAIRRALGAGRIQIAKLILGRLAPQTIVAAVIGLPAGFVFSAGVSLWDTGHVIVVWVAAAALFIVAATGAALPLYAALRVPPADALRS